MAKFDAELAKARLFEETAAWTTGLTLRENEADMMVATNWNLTRVGNM